MTDFFSLLIEPYNSYETWMIALEVTAVVLGISSVLLSMKRNIWVYPVGIISTGIYVYILFIFGLLGDCLINVYYTIMSIYGWILWSKNTEDKIHVKVSQTQTKEWFFATLLFLASLILVVTVYYLKPVLDNDLKSEGIKLGLYHLDWANWLDVFTTSVFLVGMWLMARQKIENWLFWILGDTICIPMFIYKGLVITSIQFLVFTVLAVIGYFKWKKSFHNESKKYFHTIT